MPSWHGAQLKAQGQLYLYFYTYCSKDCKGSQCSSIALEAFQVRLGLRACKKQGTAWAGLSAFEGPM